MYKLLVTSISGKQAIINVTETGGYFDLSRVLWDERTDGVMPEVVLGKMQRSGGELITLEETLPDHAAAVRAESVPEIISIRQCELALIQSGLFSQVESFIATQSEEFKAYWRRSTNVRRDHALVAAVQLELEKTDSEMDDLFILAGTFEP
jgi:hypothetical protein